MMKTTSTTNVNSVPDYWYEMTPEIYHSMTPEERGAFTVWFFEQEEERES